MIPFSSCVCPNRKPFRRRTTWLVAPQKGAKVEVEENEDASFYFHAREEEEEVKKCSPTGCRYMSCYISRRRSRRPVITPVNGLNLLDDTYSGIAQVLLSKCNHWSFNTFSLDVSTGGRSLSFLLVHLFQEYGFISYFQLDLVKVWRCFNLIEAAYHRHNPYHNSVHAADVTQAMHCFLQERKFAANLTPLEAMSSIIAAVAHDLDHPGVTQSFLVATSNHLVNLYHNSSVLENHHWRTAISCLLESGIFSHLDKELWFDIQEQIRSLILATDITRQKEFLSRFKGYLNTETLDMEKPQYRHFALQIALKCADLCNPCRPWIISQRWSYQVCQEFYRQGTFERYLNLPLTPTFDCSRTRVPKIQTDFFQYVVIPLFETWDRFLETRLSNRLLKNLRQNYNEWQLRMEIAEKQKSQEITSDDDISLEVSESGRPTAKETVAHQCHQSASIVAYSAEDLHPLTTVLSLSSTTSTLQLRKACVISETENHQGSTTNHSLSLLPSEYLLPLDFDKAPSTDSLKNSSENSELKDACDSNMPESCCDSPNSSTPKTSIGCCRPLIPTEEAESCKNDDEVQHCQSSSFFSALKGTRKQKLQSLDFAKPSKDSLTQLSTKPSRSKSDEKHSKVPNSGCSTFYNACFHTGNKTTSGKISLCSTKNIQRFITPVKITASWCWHIRRSLSAERSQLPSHEFDCLLPNRKCSNSCQTCSRNTGRRGSAPAPVFWSRDNNATQATSLENTLDSEKNIEEREVCGPTVRRWSIPLEPISS